MITVLIVVLNEAQFFLKERLWFVEAGGCSIKHVYYVLEVP